MEHYDDPNLYAFAAPSHCSNPLADDRLTKYHDYGVEAAAVVPCGPCLDDVAFSCRSRVAMEAAGSFHWACHPWVHCSFGGGDAFQDDVDDGVCAWNNSISFCGTVPPTKEYLGFFSNDWEKNFDLGNRLIHRNNDNDTS